ncbi:hypothetical protein HOD19_02220 [bacterium]|jgi:hypothetical protein|nr:hypothetical protein [bacterium]MBT4648822.1 hypothetical protein [bacterium]
MDFLVSPLGWTNWLLLVASLINLGMAIFIFNRGIKNKINLYFSLLTFSCFLWSFNVFLYLSLVDIYWVKFCFQTSFVCALGIAIFLFLFTVHFPFKSINLRVWQQYFLVIAFFVFSISAYTKWNLFSFSQGGSFGNFIVEYGLIYHVAFSLFFVILVASSLIILWFKYRKIENIFRKDTFILFWVILIGVILGLYFNLFLDYLNNFKYEWLGPVFTLLMNMAVFYLIFFDKKQ